MAAKGRGLFWLVTQDLSVREQQQQKNHIKKAKALSLTPIFL